MIDAQEARKIAEAKVREWSESSGHDFVLFDDKTQEFDLGWVFFYSTRRHVETGDIRSAVPGNAPILIDKRDGSVHPTGTARGVQYYIDQYRQQYGS